MQGRSVAIKGDTVIITVLGEIYYGGDSPEENFSDYSIGLLAGKIEHYPSDYENFIEAYIFDATNMDEKGMVKSLGRKA